MTGYDDYGNRVDSNGGIYDRNNGSCRGYVESRENSFLDKLLGKLVVVCFCIYILPDFADDLTSRFPELRTIFWVVVGYIVVKRIFRPFIQK